MKGLLFCIVSFIASSLVLPPLVGAEGTSSVVINELMPNPIGSDTGNEWLELYNSTDQKVILDGWSVNDKTSSYPLTGKSIEANSYLVIFPTISLNNADEEISITNNSRYVDTASYSTSTEGKSLERAYYKCIDFIEHPSSHTMNFKNFNYDDVTCSSVNIIEIFTKEKTSTVWKTENIYFLNSEIEAKFNSVDSIPVSSVTWDYEGKTYESENIAVKLTKLGTSKMSLKVETGTETIAAEIIIITEPIIKLNEVFPDPDGSDTGQEWIELYNPGSSEVNLSNWSINIGSKSQKLENAKVLPKSFSVIKPNISIPNTSAEVSLMTENGQVSDSFQYLDTEKDKSWARILDGIGEWYVTEPTRGTSNVLYEQDSASKTQSGALLGLADTPFTPELISPRRVMTDSASSLVDGQGTKTNIKTVDVNETAFTGFLVGEFGVFVAAFLSKKELVKISSVIMSLIRG